MDQAAVLPALLTTVGTLFAAELSDKDALFLLALATKTRASVVFAAGSVAFTVTTAIIVLLGSLLLTVVPVIAIKLAGGAIMLGYAAFEFYRFSNQEKGMEEREAKILEKRGRAASSSFVPA